MSVLSFDKNQLANLEYSLQREILSCDRSGGYMSTTIICCNTRKYHGLMVCPVDEMHEELNYVLLSSLDETIVQHGQSFNLAIHKFPGVFEPKGHKYITDFAYTPTPALTYRIGGVVLKKEMLWIHSKTRLMIRYTLLEAASPTRLRLRPFLAFRDVHSLSTANMMADGRSTTIAGGVKCRLYDKFPWLNMQVDKASEFIAAPDWHYNFEYQEEAKRGYPFREDLLTPGYFEMDISKGESVIFCCSFEELPTGDLKGIYDAEIARRSDKTDFLSCLRHSARQFIVKRENKTELIAGYPWFGSWGRDTFIALPGVTLTQHDAESAIEVIDTVVAKMRNGLFCNMGCAYNSVDAPLWFFWTLQQLEEHIGSEEVWRRYSQPMSEILHAFTAGINEHIKVVDGLVWASNPTHAMTWMDAVVDGKPVTGRDGFQVEINALWYNAVCYFNELNIKHGQKKDNELETLADQIKKSFLDTFWQEEEGFLADYVNDDHINMFIRPNQIIACSLKYKMLTDKQILAVIDKVKRHLLTPKGLRTLSPHNPLYEGRYGGDQPTRDRQYHQGTVWPWLLEHYVSANFYLYGKSFVREARQIVSNFEEDINSYGIGSIAEIYDGDPPHEPRGAISQAWSVGALLRIQEMIEIYKNTREGRFARIRRNEEKK